ncbi:MAG: DUF3619 family protein [Limnohabitans sp.]
MNLNNPSSTQDELFGYRIASYLDDANQQIPHDISERLRASRTRAIASRKINQFELENANSVLIQPNGSLKSPYSSRSHDLYSLLVSFIPLICLAVGLMLLYDFHNDQNAMELAEIDSALLVDDLPPHAYTDPAFVDYLKNQTLQKD